MDGIARAMVEGDRVLLRMPLEEDREAWAGLVAQSRSFVAPWIDLGDPEEGPGGYSAFGVMLGAVGDTRNLKMLVCLRESGEPIGVLNINEIVRGKFQSAYLGYWIGPAHAGQGLMSEALQLALSHAFETLRLHRLEANLQPDNEASRALVRRAGFIKEGYSERYLQVGGEWRDHERWAITAERWRDR